MKRNIENIKASIQKNFRFSTLSFLFIILYVNGFQLLFGKENSIVGVIFTIMMSASMVRDLTGAPLRHFLMQAVVLVWMGISAYLVTALPPVLSILINFMTLALILYAYTYEYAQHIYFPYILSYLFLIFLGPIDLIQLPSRLLAMLSGAVSILLYQWVMGRNRIAETARDILSKMIDEIKKQIRLMIQDEASGDFDAEPSNLHKDLSRLIATVYDRRKKVLCISDASFSMIDVGRGLESLSLSLPEYIKDNPENKPEVLKEVESELQEFQRFIHQEITELPDIEKSPCQGSPASAIMNHQLLYISNRLNHMSDPKHKIHYRKTAMTLRTQLQIALNFSPVRIVYALRTACLLALGVQAVRTLNLAHGKWLLFTLASLSLPYADDIPAKIKKRLSATLIGGLISLLIYASIPSIAGRTAAMMLSGYLSFYFTDYRDTFICSTIGALGGAVILGVTGVVPVGYFVLVRLGYILAGILIAVLMNCIIAPYTREKATHQLWKKYHQVVEQLSRTCACPKVDAQLYYSLVIQAFMLEAKLQENTPESDWKRGQEFLHHAQHTIRNAHRHFIKRNRDFLNYEAS